MKFRNDINGLRAVAVSLVVLYHFKIPPFSGGFIGVDIFFVISGYLMTRIIVSSLDVNSFSLCQFYFSRCKRIIPPLLLLCLILVFFGIFIIPPHELAILAKHSFSSLAFISNFIYYREAGYFDSGSIYKWLLHTWSLSVEWQFYLLLPIILIFINRFLKGKYNVFLSILLIISFVISIYITKTNTSLSYFFFGSRAWEMILGGLAYTSKLSLFFKCQSFNKNLQYLFLLTLVISGVYIDDSILWPGFYTIIPVLLTVLVLLLDYDSLFLNNFFVKKIGLWSYSIYLYHWPVLVASYIFFDEINIWVSLCLIPISIILGACSYYFIENKASVFHNQLSNPRIIFIALATMLLLCIIIFKMDGFPKHAPERVNYVSSFSMDNNKLARKCLVMEGDSFPECKFGPDKNDKDVDLVVIGDSHAYATLSAVIESNRKASIVFIAQSSCPALPSINRVGRPDCGKFMSKAFDVVKEKYTNASLLIVNRYSQYFYGEYGNHSNNTEFFLNGKKGTLKGFFNQLQLTLNNFNRSRRIYILSPIPDFPYDVIFRMSRDTMLGKVRDVVLPITNYKSRSDDVIKEINKISNKNKNITILSVDNYLCDNSYCYGSKGGVPLYRDSNHLSETGNKVLVPLFKGMWK